MSIPAIANAKICGIKDTATARLCAKLGFGAVGFVFFDKSPRNISPTSVAEISSALPSTIAKVGVFVDMSADEMLRIASLAGLTSVQLHGNETPQTAMTISKTGFKVIKAIRSATEVSALPDGVSALIECGRGELPGGNATEWNWAEAQALSKEKTPYGIAGGLSAENIVKAMNASGANACDISSGAESSPGVKDHKAIEEIAAQLAKLAEQERIFWRHV